MSIMKLDAIFIYMNSLTAVLFIDFFNNNKDSSLESFNYSNVHTCIITEMKSMLTILLQLKEKEQSGK